MKRFIHKLVLSYVLLNMQPKNTYKPTHKHLNMLTYKPTRKANQNKKAPNKVLNK